jgi:serine/threonine protein kinase
MRLRFAPASSDGAAVIAGDNAMVTRLYHPDGAYHALRVAFDPMDAADWPRHYAAMAEALPVSTEAIFPQWISPIESGITIAGVKLPAILMEWIDGPTLFEAADHAASESNSTVLQALAASFHEVSVALSRARITHGDLAPDNLMMRSNGDLVCVDLDTIQWPRMRVRSRQDGSPAYQHPRPGATPRHQDAYASLVLYTSLMVLADAPGIRQRVGHEVGVHGGGLVFSSWDLADPASSLAFSLAREQVGARSRRLLDLLVRASEGEPYRTPDILEEAFALAPEDVQRRPGTPDPSSNTQDQQTKKWDVADVIDRLRSEFGEEGTVKPARDVHSFAQTWPEPQETIPSAPAWTPAVPDSELSSDQAVFRLDREEDLTARLQERIVDAVRRKDDAAIVRIAQEAEQRSLPLDTETRRLVRLARERIVIRSRLDKALRENDRPTLAELAQSGELVVLGDTDRQSLVKVLQALEWPGLVRAIDTDDDALILAWYDEELFNKPDALPPDLRTRVELARTRTGWVEEIRAVLKRRDAEQLNALLREEPEGGLNHLSRGERARVLRIIERRAALDDLHVALREADNVRILKALNTIERVGARIENPATWTAVQSVLERASIVEQIVDAAKSDPPDDRQLAHLLPVAKSLGLSHDPALRDDLAFERLEAMVLRGAAVRRIRHAIAEGSDQDIRQAAYPDITGALEMLTDEERSRVETARARRNVARAVSR